MRSDSHFRYIPMHKVDSLTSVGLFTIYVSVNTRESACLQPKVTVCWLLADTFFWKAQHNQSIVKEGQWYFEGSFFFFFSGTTRRAREEGYEDQATDDKGRRSSTGRRFRGTAKQNQLNSGKCA